MALCTKTHGTALRQICSTSYSNSLLILELFTIAAAGGREGGEAFFDDSRRLLSQVEDLST